MGDITKRNKCTVLKEFYKSNVQHGNDSYHYYITCLKVNKTLDLKHLTTTQKKELCHR